MRSTNGPGSRRHLTLLATSVLLLSACDRDGAPVTMDDDPTVARFRAEAADYLEMRSALDGLNRRLAAGDATPEEIEQWERMQERCDRERVRLNAILYADSIDPERRRAMFWILQSAN